MTFAFLDAVGHTSFALAAMSFYVRDIMLLRGLAIASGLVGVAYNYFLPAGPLWLVIFWLGVFMTINTARIAGLVAERRSVSFTQDELELHETVFRNFSPIEFMKLMRLGEWREVAEGHRFAEQGYPIDGLKLLYNGEVVVARDGEEVGRVKDGAMIGEMSFIQGGDATATVDATRACRYVFWPKDELRGMLHRNPTMDVAMKTVFGMDLTRKLGARQQEPPAS